MNDTTICEAAKQVAFHLFGAAYTSEQLEIVTAFVQHLYENGFTEFRQLINKAIVAIINGDHVYYLSRSRETDKKYGTRSNTYYDPTRSNAGQVNNEHV